MNNRRLVCVLMWTSFYIKGLTAQCVDFKFPDLYTVPFLTAAEGTTVSLTFEVEELTVGCITEVGPFGVAVGKVDGATLCSIEYNNRQFGVGGTYCSPGASLRMFRFTYTVNRCDDKQQFRWWTTNSISSREKRITFNITYPPSITKFSVGGDPLVSAAEVPVGERLVFSCNWNPGNPRSEGYIYHQHKGRKLELRRTGLTETSITHVYAGVQCSDTGIISCEVGGVSLSKALLVQCNSTYDTTTVKERTTQTFTQNSFSATTVKEPTTQTFTQNSFSATTVKEPTTQAFTQESSSTMTISIVVTNVAAFVGVIVVAVVVNVVCVRKGKCQARRQQQPPEKTRDIIPSSQQQHPAVKLGSSPRPGHRDPELRISHAHSNHSYLDIVEDSSGIYTEPYGDDTRNLVSERGAYLTPMPNQRPSDQNQPTARPAEQNPRDHSRPIAHTAGKYPREQNQPVPLPPTQEPRDITKPIVSPGSILHGVREKSTIEEAGRGPHSATYSPLLHSQTKERRVYAALKNKNNSGNGWDEETTPKNVTGRPNNGLDEETALKGVTWRPGQGLYEETTPKFVTGK